MLGLGSNLPSSISNNSSNVRELLFDYKMYGDKSYVARHPSFMNYIYESQEGLLDDTTYLNAAKYWIDNGYTSSDIMKKMDIFSTDDLVESMKLDKNVWLNYMDILSYLVELELEDKISTYTFSSGGVNVVSDNIINAYVLTVSNGYCYTMINYSTYYYSTRYIYRQCRKSINNKRYKYIRNITYYIKFK